MSVTLELPSELEARLNARAQDAGESPGKYLAKVLEELLDDIEDYEDAVKISEQIERGEMETYSAAEVEAYLGLGN
jgi:predicted DNA-binding protein